MAIIEVDRLAKQFKVPVREQGLRASVRSLFHRQHRLVDAVGGVSFTIEPGEIVGFLGPNGAGKTTTLKMLSGLLTRPAGSARVLGFVPCGRDAVPPPDHAGDGQESARVGPAGARQLRAATARSTASRGETFRRPATS